VVCCEVRSGRALDLIERHRVTTTFMAPTLLHRLVDAQGNRRGHLVAARGDPGRHHARSVEGPRGVGARQGAVGVLRSDETGINTVLRPEDQLRKPGSCGTASQDRRYGSYARTAARRRFGEPGELRCATTAGRLLQSPRRDGKEPARRILLGGRYRYRDEDGYYFICDRRVDMIISGGVNIYPAEIGRRCTRTLPSWTRP